jgi:hypothetical protein
MPSAERVRAGAAVWDIAIPSRPGRLPGVSMAGFSDRGKDLIDLQVVPYPAATLVIDLGNGLLVDHARGQGKRGSLAAGLAPGSIRVHGRDIECLQIRLSPVVAHAVLSASPELGGTVVALDDLWGATPREPRSDCALPGHGRTGSRSPRPRSLVDTRQAGRSTRKLPSRGGRW